MEYKRWRIDGMFPVSANEASDELERIKDKHNALTAPIVVDESRPDDAKLHQCFEWDDWKAAEKYRERQARNIIGGIVIVKQSSGNKEIPVREFAHVDNDYKPMRVIMQSEELTAKLLDNAMRELEAFRVKYDNLKELAPVFNAINAVSDAIRIEKSKDVKSMFEPQRQRFA